MTEQPLPPADPNSTPEDEPGTETTAPNPGEDPDPASTDSPGPEVGQSDPVDAVQDGAPATGPEAPKPPLD